MDIKIKNYSINYEDRGSGLPVVFIHGFPLRSDMWQPQIDFLSSNGFRVITPDLRGFGKSEYAPVKKISDFSDDVAALLDHLKIKQAVIAGMSMGGYVLFDFLDRYKEKAKAAIFIVTRAASDNEKGKEKRTSLAEKTLAGAHKLAADIFNPVLFADETYEKNPELVTMVYNWASTTNPKIIANSSIAMRERKDYTPELSNFNLPALVIGGSDDRTISNENSKIIANGMPNAKLEIIPKSGHMANLENPGAFNKVILNFLKSLK
ncbi:MAG: alpha/beta hydrolase [Spirochaetia bacterium]|nr:alpha/beta hydrolase [Spirochaetia bacterium]